MSAGGIGDRIVQDGGHPVAGPWRGLEDVEFATLEWVWWFNHHRLLEPLGYVPPVEYKEAFYRRQETQDLVAALTHCALRKTQGGSDRLQLLTGPGAAPYLHLPSAPAGLRNDCVEPDAPGRAPPGMERLRQWNGACSRTPAHAPRRRAAM